MDISSSVTKVALAEEQVSIPGIDQTFAIHLDLENTQALLNSFKVSGGRDLPVDVNATGGYSDPSGNTLVVELDDAAAFEGVMTKTINEAINGSSVLSKDWISSQLTSTLSAVILKTLGVALNVTSEVVLGVSGAASNMSAGLADATASVGKARCETMYLQIAQATLDKYRDASGNPSTAALPLASGDKLVFVFDVPAPTNVDVDTQYSSVVNSEGALPAGNSNNSGVAGNDGPAVVTKNNAPPFAWDSINLKYNGPTQRIAFEIQMDGTDNSAISGLRSDWSL